MIRVNELKGLIVAQGKTQKEVAEAIGITEKTFSQKLKKGVFGSNEIDIMIKFLEIKNPIYIFFS